LPSKTNPVRSIYDGKTITCSTTSAPKKERAAVAAVPVTGGVGGYLKRSPAFDTRLRDRYFIIIYRLPNNNIASFTRYTYATFIADLLGA